MLMILAAMAAFADEPSLAVYGVDTRGRLGFADMASLRRSGALAEINLFFAADPANPMEQYPAYDGSAGVPAWETGRIRIDCSARTVTNRGFDVFNAEGRQVYVHRFPAGDEPVTVIDPSMVFDNLLQAVCDGEALEQRFSRDEARRIALALYRAIGL